MQVKFTSDGMLCVTAENKLDNEVLFNLVNNNSEKKKQEHKRQSAPRKTLEEKKCPVIGCGKKVKSLKMHMRMAHGIMEDGTIQEKIEFATGIAPVPQLAVQLGNGKYRLVKDNGLL